MTEPEADGLLYEVYALLDPVIQDFGMDDNFPFFEAWALYNRIGAYLWPDAPVGGPDVG